MRSVAYLDRTCEHSTVQSDFFPPRLGGLQSLFLRNEWGEADRSIASQPKCINSTTAGIYVETCSAVDTVVCVGDIVSCACIVRSKEVHFSKSYVDGD